MPRLLRTLVLQKKPVSIASIYLLPGPKIDRASIMTCLQSSITASTAKHQVRSAIHFRSHLANIAVCDSASNSHHWDFSKKSRFQPILPTMHHPALVAAAAYITHDDIDKASRALRANEGDI